MTRSEVGLAFLAAGEVRFGCERRFTAFLTFWHISAFGSGFGSGEFERIKIRTFLNEIKRKFRKPTVFGTFVVAGEGFEPTTSGL